MIMMEKLTENVHAGIALALYLSLTPDIMQRAQSVPTISPFTLEWPRYLLSVLSRKHSPLSHEWPAVVINAQSGYARTNKSPTVEHLLQSHTDDPCRRGLTITFLYTSGFSTLPKLDSASWIAIGVTIMQLISASVLTSYCGAVSEKVLEFTKMGVYLSCLGSALLAFIRARELRTSRTVRPDQREVVCMTSGNGSPHAVVVVTEAGGMKLEDIAAGRAGGLGLLSGIAASVLFLSWGALLVAFTGLDAPDAWGVLGIAALGTVVEMFAAKTWRSANALGFKVKEKVVVHEAKVMQTLMRAEDIESGVGTALLPVFFPGPLRPKEEEWWGAKKTGAQSV